MRAPAVTASLLFAASLCLCGSSFAAPQVGWYWNPAESGRGFFVESQNGTTFIGAYLYDADGHASWLVAGGPNADPYNFSGDLYYKSNGQTLFGDYVAPGPAVVVGQITVHFTDDTHGTVTWPGGVVQIQREIFDASQAPSFQPLSGWWWNPDESGSGYSVEVQGNNIFVVGFMYDDGGRAVWYFSAGPMTDDQTFHGAVLQFAGGQTIGGPYHPPGTPTSIASLDIAFTAQNEATFTFTEGASFEKQGFKAGRTRSRPLQPQLPKPGTFVFPQAYTGFFDMRSTYSDSTVYSSLEFLPIGSPRFSKAGTGIDVQLYQPEITAGVGLVIDYEERLPNCTFVGTQTIDDFPLNGVSFTMTQYFSYVLNFNIPIYIVPGTLTCQTPDGTTMTNVSLPFPGFTQSLGGPVQNKDALGNRCYGCFHKEGTAQPVPNVTVTYRWNFTPVTPAQDKRVPTTGRN